MWKKVHREGNTEDSNWDTLSHRSPTLTTMLMDNRGAGFPNLDVHFNGIEDNGNGIFLMLF